MILTSFQEQEQIKQKEPGGATFATVGEVYQDGLSLIFDGTERESEKHYKSNLAIKFIPGQRVKLFRTSGTYIIEYPIGRQTI